MNNLLWKKCLFLSILEVLGRAVHYLFLSWSFTHLPHLFWNADITHLLGGRLIPGRWTEAEAAAIDHHSCHRRHASKLSCRCWMSTCCFLVQNADTINMSGQHNNMLPNMSATLPNLLPFSGDMFVCRHQFCQHFLDGSNIPQENEIIKPFLSILQCWNWHTIQLNQTR